MGNVRGKGDVDSTLCTMEAGLVEVRTVLAQGPSAAPGSRTLRTANSGGDGADVGKGSSWEGQESAHQVNCVQEPRYAGTLLPAEESLYGKGLPKSGWTMTVFPQIHLCWSTRTLGFKPGSPPL